MECCRAALNTPSDTHTHTGYLLFAFSHQLQLKLVRSHKVVVFSLLILFLINPTVNEKSVVLRLSLKNLNYEAFPFVVVTVEPNLF